jgi:hypothetical protein
VLLVVGAEATIVRTAPFDGRVVDVGHFGRFEENLAAAPVVIDVVGNEHALRAVALAALQQINAVVLKDYFGVAAPIALGADGSGGVVEEVGADSVSHGRDFLPCARKKRTSRQ